MERKLKCQATTKKSFHQLQTKAMNNFNLLDYVVETSISRKTKGSVVRGGGTSEPLIKGNRGKKRDVDRTKYTKLKKIILQNRELSLCSDSENSDVNTNNEKNYHHEDDDVSKLKGNLQHLKISSSHKRQVEDVITDTKSVKIIYSRRFQNYCENTTSAEVCNLTENLLKELQRFQKRAYTKNQVKARAHKRYIVGFKEVERQLNIRKTKLIIFAPDCEKCDLSDGITDRIKEMKVKCKNAGIPYLFACSRKHLGYILFKKVPVSCIGILRYDGAQNIFHDLIQCLEQNRKKHLAKYMKSN